MPQTPPPPPCPHCGYPLDADGCARCGGAVYVGPGGGRIRPGRGFAPLDAAQGFARLLASGIELMTRKEFFGTLRGAAIANLIGVALLAGAWIWLVYPAFRALVATGWGPLELLRGPVGWSDPAFTMILTVVSAFLIAPALLQAITAPFVDRVADAVEQMMGGNRMRPAYRRGASRLHLNVGSSSQVLTMQVLMLVPCLLLSFCGFGLPLAVLAAAFLNGLLWLETPFQRRGYDFDERLRVARHNWARVTGWGLAFQLGMFIPLFNMFLLAPAAVASITQLYFRLEKTSAAGVVAAPTSGSQV